MTERPVTRKLARELVFPHLLVVPAPRTVGSLRTEVLLMGLPTDLTLAHWCHPGEAARAIP